MGEAPKFTMEAILTVTTDRYLCDDMGQVYALLGHMAGVPLYTHQLPRAAEYAKPILAEHLPWLADVSLPMVGEDVDIEAGMALIRDLKAEHGAEFEIPAGMEGYEPKGAIEEMREMRPDIPIQPIVLGEGGV